jgi:hypothetical protein
MQMACQVPKRFVVYARFGGRVATIAIAFNDGAEAAVVG